MSANNRICYMFWEDNRWHVWHSSLSACYYEPPANSETFTTKGDAMTRAIQMAQECCVLEGGIEEITSEEQIEALAYEIEDLSCRLRLLLGHGRQWETNFN